VINAVDSSTEVVLVAMRDTLSLKNAKLGLETLERMEYDRRHVKILLNRANTNVGIDREDVLAILGRTVDVLVPSDRDITRSINHGKPIAMQRGTEAAKAFRSLAELFVAASSDGQELPVPAEAPAGKQRKKLFRRPVTT
jgi:Flp pilus assembly CpaE family ATPase